jgi:predicted transposase/invertase (TIGR01784 family)
LAQLAERLKIRYGLPMIDVVPLRYGTIFKKAFSDPETFSAFARDILELDLTFTHVVQEQAFHPPVGKVDVRYDLYAEDTEHRAIVELQHVREDDMFDRFHYYHLIAQIEQVRTGHAYTIDKTVYTIVVLTRLPNDKSLRFDVASQTCDLVTHQGRKLGLFDHRMVFINPRAISPTTPKHLRLWLEFLEDSLDSKIDEKRYTEPHFQRILKTIQTDNLTPNELYLLKEETSWENARQQAKGEGFLEGVAKGDAKGEAKTLRLLITDLCELLEVAILPEQSAWLASATKNQLEQVRSSLKQTRCWPDPLPEPLAVDEPS